MVTEVASMTNGSEDVSKTAIRDLKLKSKPGSQSRTPEKTSTLIITGVTRVSDEEAEQGEGQNQQWTF